jgi:hypothetical protein
MHAADRLFRDSYGHHWKRQLPHSQPVLNFSLNCLYVYVSLVRYELVKCSALWLYPADPRERKVCIIWEKVVHAGIPTNAYLLPMHAHMQALTFPLGERGRPGGDGASGNHIIASYTLEFAFTSHKIMGSISRVFYGVKNHDLPPKVERYFTMLGLLLHDWGCSQRSLCSQLKVPKMVKLTLRAQGSTYDLRQTKDLMLLGWKGARTWVGR